MRYDEPKQVESNGVIDGELADQLRELSDDIEAVPWGDVPDVHPMTASAFNRLLLEARSQLLGPRVIADGGTPVGRRTFLGAAAALATLPPVETWTENKNDRDAGGPDSLFGALWMDTSDDDVTYSVRSYTSSEEWTDVGLQVGAAFGHVTLEMTADRAEQLADEIRDAAREAR